MSQSIEKASEKTLRSKPSFKPSAATLKGRLITLIPFNPNSHKSILLKFSSSEPITLCNRSFVPHESLLFLWKSMPFCPFYEVTERENFISEVHSKNGNFLFCIIENSSKQPIGIIGTTDSSPNEQKIRIRYGMGCSTFRKGEVCEMLYLLCGYIFKLGYKRIEFKTAACNSKGIDAMLNAGFRFERIEKYENGINDESIDLASFRLLRTEWKISREVMKESIEEGFRTIPKL